MISASLLAACSLFAQPAPVLYMPLGDSYTIGEGLADNERFPNQLVELLAREGTKINLGPNPSRTGWTTQDLIDQELPLFKRQRPQLATLLIGVNDWVQNVPTETFTENFRLILTEMIAVLPNKRNLIVLTIPDFSATPAGKNYGNGRNISKGIASFNTVIIEECRKMGVTVVDIYPSTQEMKNKPTHIAEDGLHPSSKEYAVWAQLVLPYFKKLL